MVDNLWMRRTKSTVNWMYSHLNKGWCVGWGDIAFIFEFLLPSSQCCKSAEEAWTNFFWTTAYEPRDSTAEPKQWPWVRNENQQCWIIITDELRFARLDGRVVPSTVLYWITWKTVHNSSPPHFKKCRMAFSNDAAVKDSSCSTHSLRRRQCWQVLE
jgi:hypothetical protein